LRVPLQSLPLGHASIGCRLGAGQLLVGTVPKLHVSSLTLSRLNLLQQYPGPPNSAGLDAVGASAPAIWRLSMTTWEQVREAWATAEQLGFQAVLQAAKVGQMLIELKASTAHGEFMANYQRAGISGRQQVQNLMHLARNQQLLKEHKPESQRAALMFGHASIGCRLGAGQLLVGTVPKLHVSSLTLSRLDLLQQNSGAANGAGLDTDG
jgi:hypothetical protein